MHKYVSPQAVQVQGTYLQASNRATWNIYLEQISRTHYVVCHEAASQCLFRDQIRAQTTTVDIYVTLAYLFLVWHSALKQDSVSALQGLVINCRQLAYLYMVWLSMVSFPLILFKWAIRHEANRVFLSFFLKDSLWNRIFVTAWKKMILLSLLPIYIYLIND